MHFAIVSPDSTRNHKKKYGPIGREICFDDWRKSYLKPWQKKKVAQKRTVNCSKFINCTETLPIETHPNKHDFVQCKSPQPKKKTGSNQIIKANQPFQTPFPLVFSFRQDSSPTKAWPPLPRFDVMHNCLPEPTLVK